MWHPYAYIHDSFLVCKLIIPYHKIHQHQVINTVPLSDFRTSWSSVCSWKWVCNWRAVPRSTLQIGQRKPSRISPPPSAIAAVYNPVVGVYKRIWNYTEYIKTFSIIISIKCDAHWHSSRAINIHITLSFIRKVTHTFHPMQIR